MRRLELGRLAASMLALAAALAWPPAQAAPGAGLVDLGCRLFHDRRLAVNGTLSCVMCHLPEQGFTSNELRTPVGIEGVSLRRNAPTLWDVGEVRALFHDGRAPSLEAQALQPLVHPQEMANASVAVVVARLSRLPDYRRAALTPARLAAALAAYQRTLQAGPTPLDRWRAGETRAMGALAQRGWVRFQALGCVQCHAVTATTARLTDGAFHNTGVQARSEALAADAVAVALAPGLSTQVDAAVLARLGAAPESDTGRHEVTGAQADLRAWRTPSLRNVALTAPYMHDGSLPTLEAVLDFYAGGGWPADAAQDARLRPLALSADDRAALLALLHALTTPVAARVTAARDTPPVRCR